jgi:hypothetical protein
MSHHISRITPEETPCLSSFGRTRATATYHEWLEDVLRAAAANAWIEGFQLTVVDPTPRKELGNHCQILSVGYGVTGTQEAVAHYGIKSEIAYQMAKAAKELALDIEFALINNLADVAGSTTTPRQFKGLPGWIVTNTIAAGGYTLKENMVNDALQKCWAAGGKPHRVYLSGSQKRIVSQWSGGGEKFYSQEARKLIVTVRSYEGDFGNLEFFPHRMMPDNAAFIIDPKYCKVAHLREIKTESLPKTHDAHKQVMWGELTLEMRAEKAHAKITGLTLEDPEPDPEA